MNDDCVEVDDVALILGETVEQVLAYCRMMGVCPLEEDGIRHLPRPVVKRLYEIHHSRYVPPEAA